MNVDAYLERIGYAESRIPNSATLRQLHRAHLFTVPFENLDIPLQTPIVLSLPHMYKKVVVQRRGGFCYELNGLFCWLLDRLGFQVRLLSGRVFSDGTAGPEFDHLLLHVKLEKDWIADVGFGDSFLEPMPLHSADEVASGGARYRITATGNDFTLHQHQGSDWEAQYLFTLLPRDLHEFDAMCKFQQTSPQSSFTQKVVCSLANEGGRLTLSNNRLIKTIRGKRSDTKVANEEELRSILKSGFGIELDGEGWEQKILQRGLKPS